MSEISHEQRIEQLVSSMQGYSTAPNSPAQKFFDLSAQEFTSVNFNDLDSIMSNVVKFVKTLHNHFSYVRRQAAIVRLIRSKVVCSLIVHSKANSTRSSRRSSKPAKSNNSSSSSRGGDPDPDPEPSSFYYSCFTSITSFLTLISSLCLSFVATSTNEVTE